MPDRTPTAAQATDFILNHVGSEEAVTWSNYGYDIYLPHVVASYAVRNLGIERHFAHNSPRSAAIAPVFFDAAWNLCRRGILRPTVRTLNEQGTASGGYSYTGEGREWLREYRDRRPFIPADSSAMAELLERFADRFGDGFHSRAQEAVACDASGHFLACCAMCGAAAESILLRLAEGKSGDADLVLRTYRRASGRSDVLNLVVGQATGRVQSQLRQLMDLLGYWRDDAAHGRASDIGTFEAMEAVTRLLRLAQFAADNWNALTARAQGSGKG